jgi:hypothetical protein
LSGKHDWANFEIFQPKFDSREIRHNLSNAVILAWPTHSTATYGDLCRWYIPSCESAHTSFIILFTLLTLPIFDRYWMKLVLNRTELNGFPGGQWV